jgi:hypothetical protein
MMIAGGSKQKNSMATLGYVAFLSMMILNNIPSTLAFVSKSSYYSSNVPRTKDVSLQSLPTMIIGPMIKKMRENQAKKRMPMIDAKDAQGQAPGLRVGGNAWKWPPIWPYDQDFFTPNEDITTPNPAAQMNPMGMLTLSQQPIDIQSDEKVDKLDPVQYWGQEKADVKTELDPEAAERLKR